MGGSGKSIRKGVHHVSLASFLAKRCLSQRQVHEMQRFQPLIVAPRFATRDVVWSELSTTLGELGSVLKLHREGFQGSVASISGNESTRRETFSGYVGQGRYKCRRFMQP